MLPEARALAAEGFIAGGTRGNREFVADVLDASNLPDDLTWIICDAQTSGGLLLSVPEAESARLLDALRNDAHLESARAIGRIEAREKPTIRVIASSG